ncbi:MAG TPA: hypothetical protein VFY93_01515 [Planctomycetota bacterium]|nr:hypothetical protein [Planctomycetota bacterium]
MRPFLLLALLLLPAAAADDIERLRLHRLAMEAQIRIGDTLQETGDRAGARAAYEEALRLEHGPVRGGPAVRLALAWLAAHQDDDGKWDCDEFMKHDPKGDACDGAGGRLYDHGVTGLALLAFLRAGDVTPGVRKGLAFLAGSEDRDGCVGTRETPHFIYNHAVATWALSEGFARTGDRSLGEAAQRALDFLASARNPYLGWRYGVRQGENDTSVTACCARALAAGRQAGLRVDEDAFEGARAWFDKMTDPASGRVGYNVPGGMPARPQALVDRFPAEKSEAITAAAISVLLEMGDDPATSEPLRKGLGLCANLPPVWNPDDGSIDMYYWFHATEAMAHVGGDAWAAWRRSFEAAALPAQYPAGSGARTGSWDPAGPWGNDGGRVYSTAVMALALAAEPVACAPRPGPR